LRMAVPMGKAFAIFVCRFVLLGSFVSVASASVAPGTFIDNQAGATYLSASGSTISTTSDTVQVITEAGPAASNLTLTKTVSTSTASPGDRITFTLNAANTGAGDAAPVTVGINGTNVNKIVVRDVIPDNTKFAAFVTTGASTPLYHLYGAATANYLTAAPSDLSTVDAVAFALEAFPSGAAASFSFSVTLNSNATGTISNTAVIYFNNGSNTTTPSNTVIVNASGPAPIIGFFTNGGFSRPAPVGSAGLPLYIQANAAGCNANPLVADTVPITVSALLSADIETFTATETGPNTGIFQVLPAPPTRDAASNPVIQGDGIMEVQAGDTLTAVLKGCGAASVNASLVIDPSAVVFDSHSNQPVAGAKVTLIDVTGQGNGGNPGQPATVLMPDGLTPAASTVTTAADGRFKFLYVPPSTYKFTIVPPAGFTYPSTVAMGQLPAGHAVDANASYGKSFVLSTAGPLRFDQPLDLNGSGLLLVEKSTAQSTAQIGDFLDYTIQVKNTSSVVFNNVQVSDALPRGFAYQLGTTRIKAALAPDPAGGKGPNLVFIISTLPASSEVDITYRVQVGSTAVMGANTNFASANAGTTKSNSASATVLVLGGAFSNEGFVIGKVFADCNGNGKQDLDEPGIPGVRVLLEDQTSAITDIRGKYSIYGVAPLTHVVKIDPLTLPEGYQGEILNHRNAGDPNSMFVDMKNGQMFRADFATACSAKLQSEIADRKKKQGRGFVEAETGLKANFTYDTIRRGTVEAKAAPSAGVSGQTRGAGASPAGDSPAGTAAPAGSSSTAPSATPGAPASPKSTPASSQPDKTKSGSQTVGTLIGVEEQPLEPLEAVVPHLDPKLGFINLKDGQVMPYTQTPVRVKGPANSVFKLYVNDVEVGDKRVGKKVVDSARQVEAWEFIGVELKPGHNSVRLAQFDPWGNQRGAALITLIAPKPLHKFRIDVPKQAVADGKTPVKIAVHLLDADDVPVMVPVEITLTSTDGEWQVKDVDPRQPGVQVYVKGGEALLPLIPPAEPGTAKIRFTSGSVQSEAQVVFVPELRPMIAAGVVDEIISFRNFSGNSIAPVQSNDGFEEELRALSISNANGTTQLQSHVGLSLKGKVLGSYLLTLAYDSDKSNERLFRDIQPDEYYPVYGDSSVRSYDAQSTSRAYLRVDKGRSYVLFGDFATTQNDSTRVLTVYNRSLTGVREHYQNDRVNVTAFASHTTYSQHVQEIPANGTSGPYILSNATGVINSETVQILVRDRNQPAVILKITPETRFVDYEFEPYSGEILFTSPIPSLDPDLNPVSIRVTYEMDQGGARFWVAGVDGSVKLNDRIRVGGTYVADLNPGDQFFMKGFNSTIKLGSHTTLNGEFATTHQDTVGDGDGYHFELLHDSENLKARAYFGRTSALFDNINSLLNQGRGEGGLKLSWKFTPSTRLVADAIRTENTAAGGTQVGALLSVEHTMKNKMQVEFGVRRVEQGNLAASASTAGSTNTNTTSIRTKLTVPVPNLPRLQTYGEYEQDVRDFSKKIAAVGGTFQLFERAKVYARRELISSLGNQFSLNTSQQQQATVFGIEGDYLKNTHVFSEYRDRDDFSAKDTEAAIGLRNTWTVLPGLKLNTGVESVKVLKGSGATNNLAFTSSVDFTPTSKFKGTSRFEWRASSNTRGYLSTLGAALKISQNWTFLGRNVLSTENSTSGPQSGQFRERAQMGFAFRDSATSSWNWLGMAEFRSERDFNPTAPTARRFVVLSSNVNYEPSKSLVLSGRYATKFTVDKSLGLDSSAGDQLASLRLTCDLAKHWDAGFLVSTMFSNGFSSRQYSAGPELGRMLAKNLWVSVGYNLLGYHDTDLSGENQMSRGVYIRFRFKFDEGLLQKIPGAKPK